MQRYRSRILLTVGLLTVSVAGAARGARWSIEDPSAFPGVWYRIGFDENGDKYMGDGDGDGWHHYPAADVYRMWFHNGAYDPDRKGKLYYHVYLESVDPGRTTYAVVRFIWTTPEWSLAGHGSPPYPEDLPTLSDESDAISSRGIFTVDNYTIGLGSKEAEIGHTISGYNPEWVGIEIAGRNAYIFRGAFHECVAKEPGDDDGGGGGDTSFKVCCRRSTGDCYTISGAPCVSTYEQLPPGSTCADCVQTSGERLDFGDAPDPGYPTRLANDGARHTIVSGLHLGKGVDSETDGQPNAGATGDDENGPDEDGVTFTSLLQPGASASVEVAASAQGYLNAWIDFDADSRFDGPGEQIFQDEILGPGASALAFDVPGEAASGKTYARFRFNSRGLLDADGPASDGEVEDYQVYVMSSYGPQPTSGITTALVHQPPVQLDGGQSGVLVGSNEPSNLHLHRIVADDWVATSERPVTGIHWWGAFDGWSEPYLPPTLPVAYHIAIWTDEPALSPGSPNTFNHPGMLVWETYCMSWTWALAGYESVSDGGDPAACFQFSCWLSQDEWFYPEYDAATAATSPTFYWLSVAALYDPKGPKVTNDWGFKTRPHAFSEAATIIRQVIPADDLAIRDPLASPWPPTLGAQWALGQSTQTAGTEPLDLAFQLTTFTPIDATPPQFGGPKSIQAKGLGDLSGLAEAWLNASR